VSYRVHCKVCEWDIIVDEEQLEWLKEHFCIDEDENYEISVED